MLILWHMLLLIFDNFTPRYKTAFTAVTTVEGIVALDGLVAHQALAAPAPLLVDLVERLVGPELRVVVLGTAPENVVTDPR